MNWHMLLNCYFLSSIILLHCLTTTVLNPTCTLKSPESFVKLSWAPPQAKWIGTCWKSFKKFAGLAGASDLLSLPTFPYFQRGPHILINQPVFMQLPAKALEPGCLSWNLGSTITSLGFFRQVPDISGPQFSHL